MKKIAENWTKQKTKQKISWTKLKKTNFWALIKI